jgi:hypothetical protein
MLRQKCRLHVQTPDFTRIMDVTANSYVNTVLESPPIVTDAARGDPYCTLPMVRAIGLRIERLESLVQ